MKKVPQTIAVVVFPSRATWSESTIQKHFLAQLSNVSSTNIRTSRTSRRVEGNTQK